LKNKISKKNLSATFHIFAKCHFLSNGEGVCSQQAISGHPSQPTLNYRKNMKKKKSKKKNSKKQKSKKILSRTPKKKIKKDSKSNSEKKSKKILCQTLNKQDGTSQHLLS